MKTYAKVIQEGQAAEASSQALVPAAAASVAATPAAKRGRSKVLDSDDEEACGGACDVLVSAPRLRPKRPKIRRGQFVTAEV